MPNTLTKFGVPLGGGGGRGGILMPKLAYRYRVRVSQFGPISGGLDFTQQVMTCGRPQVEYEEVTVHSYNSRAYVAGKHQWSTLSVTLRDDVTNAISTLVGHQVQKQVNHFEQTAPLAGQNYKFTMRIEILDGGNDVVLESWFLEGCFIQNVNYSDLDYSSSDPQTIELTVRFDNATQEDIFTENPELLGGTNVG